jgi:tetratricopeptide (TPR) repeat protein
MAPTPPTPEQLAAWAEAEAAAERELAAADAAKLETAAPTTAAPAAPTGRPGGLLKRAATVLGLGLLCAGGPIASAVYFWAKPAPAAEAPSAVAEKAEPGPLHPNAIDELIRAGAFAEALTACRRPGPELPPQQQRQRAYREALCLEALGQVKEADEMYHKAEPADGDRAAWARALLGRARCALATDDLTGAQQYLDRVALRSGHPDCTGTHVVEECALMRARIAAARMGAVRALDPFDPEALAWPGLGGALDLYLDWLPADTLPAASSGLPDGPSALAVRRGASGFEVTAHTTERPVADAVRALAEAAGLTLQLPSTLALPKDATALDVQGMPLGDVLGALLGTSGIGWKIEGDVLALAPAADAAHTPAAAEKALRSALVSAPGHPRAHAARIWLANFDVVARRPREALKVYQQVLDAVPPLPEAPYAAYNLGLVELRSGELLSARSRFVDLVDRAPRSRWADYGWWWAGRTNLDTGDTASARKAFRAALGNRTREIASAVALGACACALLDDNDEEARTALEEGRVATRESHIALWTAFENLLRYRGAPTAGRRNTLLSALREADDGRVLGPGGAYLAGRVYRDLGMPDQMVALYDKATESIRGPLAVRMTFDAAAWYDLSDRFESARQRYRAVAATDPKGLGSQAELRLAALALRTGNADECLRRCRGLLDRSGAHRTEVLALMGRGYEVKRNYRFAAECFAGRVPLE